MCSCHSITRGYTRKYCIRASNWQCHLVATSYTGINGTNPLSRCHLSKFLRLGRLWLKYAANCTTLYMSEPAPTNSSAALTARSAIWLKHGMCRMVLDSLTAFSMLEPRSVVTHTLFCPGLGYTPHANMVRSSHPFSSTLSTLPTMTDSGRVTSFGTSCPTPSSATTSLMYLHWGAKLESTRHS